MRAAWAALTAGGRHHPEDSRTHRDKENPMGATAPVVPSLVLPLGDPLAADARLVGPKAAHLSSLARTWPVPDDFCLTADAYRTAAAAGGLTIEIREAVDRASTDLVGEVASPPPVAVRSSALD
jgi:hypothetical protein